jgi:phenylalanyl-tRNA synthetase alpha chain
VELSPQESLVLQYLKDRQEVFETEIVINNLSQDNIRGAISWLEKKGLVDVHVKSDFFYVLGEEGISFINSGLPETRLYELLREYKSLEFKKASDLLGSENFKIAMSQIAKFGIKPQKGVLIYNDDQQIKQRLEERANLLKKIELGGEPGSNDMTELELLLKRNGLIERKERKIRMVKINENGSSFAKTIDISNSIGILTSEQLLDGSWKDAVFRSYDLNMPGMRVKRNGKHPLTVLINEVRRIFLSMGFEELKDPYIEFAGWNMDALFIPQDHPARDMQDTFFLETSREIKPSEEDSKLFKRAGIIHKQGINGYRGWNYQWSETEANKLLLRTHTTSSTMRALWRKPKEEGAVFSVDKVFRHESVDWKHLAEFHQVEGAIHAKDANLSTLKWYLRNFYSELGFDHIELIPSYYPYTEPSLDVLVKINGKEVEMGGSGIMRPEVNSILGLKHNVIAWGLGLERLALLYYGLDDLRQLYESDLSWLQNYKIKY